MLRRMIFPLLLGLVGGAVLVSLGVWQLQRLAWKEGILAQIEARIAADPVPVPDAPQVGDDQYLPVRVSGQFTGEGLDVLVSRKQIGAGYRVIAVMEADGRRLLVDRGFLPVDQRGVARPEGQARVTGNLLWPDEVDSYTPAPDARTGIWFARDLPAMAAALGTEPVLVVARSVTPADAAVEPLPVDTSGIPNDHLGYAIQWFGLALVWVGMTAFLLWRIRRRAE
ncbi:MAG: SURF1 family protein [Gemmobacter sp.]